MRIPLDDYEKQCSLINEKYQLEKEVNNSFQYIKNNLSRVIQLSTIAKLTTDNHSIINDFPIDYDIYGLEPYFEYTIKVSDTFGTELYIFVHYKGNKTYLLPLVVGFESNSMCSSLKITDNWRTRGLIKDEFITYKDSFYEFGIQGMMIVVDNLGIYGTSIVLNKLSQNNLLKEWQNQEDKSLNNENTLTIFSSSALILQIWLHTICLWRKRCVNRKVKVVYSSGKKEESSDISSHFSSSKNTIVDINKDIVVYVNNNLTKREFKGFYIKQSERCGHFRHLPNKIIYIAPTTVHYKKLIPDERLVGRKSKPLIYRNSEDFLREKSYLEYDVHLMLKENSINYISEKTFPWLGKKRLDFYLPEKNIAIECQGVQHFYPYGAKDKDFEKRQKRDIDKYNECSANGIKLLYFVNPEIPIPKEMSEKYFYITSLDDLLKELNN